MVHLMEEGRIVESGTPSELAVRGLLPAEVVKTDMTQSAGQTQTETAEEGKEGILAAKGDGQGTGGSPSSGGGSGGAGGGDGDGADKGKAEEGRDAIMTSQSQPALPHDDAEVTGSGGALFGAAETEGAEKASGAGGAERAKGGKGSKKGKGGKKGKEFEGGGEAAPAAGAPSAAEMGRGSTRKAAALFFVQAMGGAPLVVPVLLLVLCLAVCRALSDWSLGEWVRNGTQEAGAILYAALIGATVVSGLVQGVAVVSRMLGASSKIHDEVLRRVLRAPKAWLDATPHGENNAGGRGVRGSTGLRFGRG
jgi:hypothetical protein